MKTEKEIKEFIRASIENEPVLSEALKQVEIKVEDETVILIGRMQTHEQHQHLINFISGLKDFKILTNITVEPDMSESSADDNLKKLITSSLRSVGIAIENLQIKVSRSRVYLDGKVYSEDERTRIYRFVERIFGVRAICNNLTFPRSNAHYQHRRQEV
jgi:osmotically-inducible protein OsmY